MKDAKKVTVALRLNGLPKQLGIALRYIASAVETGKQWKETNFYVGPETEGEVQIGSPGPTGRALSPEEFSAAWAEVADARGCKYCPDALETFRVGWELACATIATPERQIASPRPTVRALSPKEADDALLAREVEKFNDLLAEGLRDTSVDPRVAPRLVRVMQDCGWSTEEKQMSDGSIAVKVWPADKDGNPRVCEDCGGKLGPTFIDEHQAGCPRFPL